MDQSEPHYSLDEWLEFVRGACEPERTTAMQQHLKSGCTNCARAVWLWGKVIRDQTPQRESGPPDSVVRLVLGAERELISAAGRFARVLFDSLRHPSRATVRGAASTPINRVTPGGTAAGSIGGSAAAPRQVLATGEDLMIDLHVECVARGKYSLTGQVYRASYTPEFAADLSISLMKGDLLAGHTSTNSLGEFHMDCDSNLGEGYTLVIVDKGKQVLVSLALPDAA